MSRLNNLYQHRHHKGSEGFTAIELLVVISIIAVLASLAGPSFSGLIERWRVRSAVEDLQSVLYYARAEAIKRGGNVTLEPASGGWTSGWEVKNGSTTLQTSPAPTRVDIRLADSSDANVSGSIGADQWGQLASTAGSGQVFVFRLTPAGASASSPAATSLCVYPAGSIRRLGDGSGAC